MFLPCIIRLGEITNTMHRFILLLYSICWLLRISAVVGHLPVCLSLPYAIAFSILRVCQLGHMLYIVHVYHILTHCTSCCYYVILTSVRPGVITSSNLFYSTHGTLHTDSYLLYILDKPPYRSVFSSNSDGSRSSLKMADYCRNM
jgi:hypothetical protein